MYIMWDSVTHQPRMPGSIVMIEHILLSIEKINAIHHQHNVVNV